MVPCNDDCCIVSNRPQPAMPRMTRAKAAEVAEHLHIDEDAVLELPSDEADVKLNTTPEPDERAPLGEITPNSGGSREEDSEAAELKKSTRGKKGGKIGAKGKKNNVGTSTGSQAEAVDEASEAIPEGQNAAASPVNEAAEDGIMQDASKGRFYGDLLCSISHKKANAASR